MTLGRVRRGRAPGSSRRRAPRRGAAAERRYLRRGPTDTSDVVVIGAGAIGASCAYHLARRGCRVLVLERRGRAGLGSTGKASGGFRGQFTTDICVRLSLLARDKLLRFRDEVGADPGYRPVGYVFMAKTPAQLEALRAALAVQRAAGLREACEVAPADIARLSPAMSTDGAVGGTWCPTDGYIVPLQIMRGYLEAAVRLGARVRYGAGEAACLVDSGSAGARRIRGVRTEAGEIATRRVVNAAGPWAGLVARTAGVNVPVTPLRRQTAQTQPFPALPDDTPMTINVDDRFHFRVLEGRALLLWPGDTPTDDPFDTTFEPRWLDEMLPYAHANVPCLRDARIDRERCLCGLYEMSPDKHVILGPAAGVEGLYLVNGSSGHGVMHAPALGQLVAEMIVDGRAHTLDVHPLRPSRFDEGALNLDTGVL